jgi:hypothetical protein
MLRATPSDTLFETFAAAIVTAALVSEATQKTIYVGGDGHTSTIPQ